MLRYAKQFLTSIGAHLSEGMVHVYVNGAQSMEDGKHTESRGGTFIPGK